MITIMAALLLATYTPAEEEIDWDTAPCSECVTDSECEALCAPCPDNPDDWSCNRNPQPEEEDL